MPHIRIGCDCAWLDIGNGPFNLACVEMIVEVQAD